MFCYADNKAYLVYVSNEKFKHYVDFLLLKNENKLNYVYIKYFNKFVCNKIKNKDKKYFRRYCLQSFSSEKVLQEHKETCLKINGKQNVELRSGSIKSKNHFKQLSVSIYVPFKIYADFESIWKGVQSNDRNNNSSYTERYQSHIPCSFAYKVVCIDDKFSKPVVRLKCNQ